MGAYDKLELAPNFGPGWNGQLISVDGADAKGETVYRVTTP